MKQWPIKLLLFSFCATVRSTPVMLTVQTQSPEHIHALTHSGQRQLATFDGTASSIVDVNEQYTATRVQSVPTLSLLESIAFDNKTEMWSFAYETMAVDSSVPGQINRYHRVLYLTHSGHDVGSSDTANPCLQENMSYVECLESLRENYIVLDDDAVMPERDRLQTSENCSCHGIHATLEHHENSGVQTLRLNIPHQTIRNALSRLRNSTHADSLAQEERGIQPALDFGIGMMFLPQLSANLPVISPNNLLIFDMFTVLENTFDQLAVMKQTSYSIATHVAFWTAAAQSNAQLRVVSIEYLLDYGHLLTDVKIAINNGSLTDGGSMVPITNEDCTAMNSMLLDLQNAGIDSRCIVPHNLCEPNIVVDGSGSSLQTWATVVFPIPPWHTGSVFQFNTMIFSNLSTAHGGRGMPALSSLNFFTSHALRVACGASETVAFDVTRHVRAELYRGHLLVFEQIQGTFTVFNDTSLSSAEALMTLVLRPDDSEEALSYFETYTNERLRLDELYMSHGKLTQTFPSNIANRAVGTGNGRTTLQLDPELAERCPLMLTTPPEIGLCVTTKDWSLEGKMTRPTSTVYYVHQVGPESKETDLKWLADNVFGNADPGTINAFRDATLAQPFINPLASARKPYAAVFWIWPVFSWPNTPPVGLVDKTVVSLAWSIAP